MARANTSPAARKKAHGRIMGKPEADEKLRPEQADRVTAAAPSEGPVVPWLRGAASPTDNDKRHILAGQAGQQE